MAPLLLSLLLLLLLSSLLLLLLLLLLSSLLLLFLTKPAFDVNPRKFRGSNYSPQGDHIETLP
jgi:hypothetical protein